MRIGVDSGGTFTDVVAYDPARGRLVFHKVASTPNDPAAGIVSGALGAAERAEAQAADVAILIHGTTVATNQVLQRAGRTGGADHHRGVPRRAAHPAAVAPAHVRPARAPHRAAGAA